MTLVKQINTSNPKPISISYRFDRLRYGMTLTQILERITGVAIPNEHIERINNCNQTFEIADPRNSTHTLTFSDITNESYTVVYYIPNGNINYDTTTLNLISTYDGIDTNENIKKFIISKSRLSVKELFKKLSNNNSTENFDNMLDADIIDDFKFVINNNKYEYKKLENSNYEIKYSTNDNIFDNEIIEYLTLYANN